MALQKKLQGCPAGSPHGASPALNAFHLSAWMPLQVHPANIRAGNCLVAYLSPADNSHGSLLGRLKGAHQPVIKPRNRFSASCSSFLAGL